MAVDAGRALVVDVDFDSCPAGFLWCRSGRDGRGSDHGPSGGARLSAIEANAADYDGRFAGYRRLHDYFGRGENKVMHHLRDLRRRAHGGE
jgi:hypothetical protein